MIHFYHSHVADIMKKILSLDTTILLSLHFKYTFK